MENYSLKREAGQTVDQMAEQLIESQTGRMYPAVDDDSSSRTVFIRGLIDNAVDFIGQSFPAFRQNDDIQIRRGKVDLNDLDEVAAVSYRFMMACAKAGNLPSFSLLCAALGYSRVYVYGLLRRKKNEVTELLSVLQTAFAGILESTSLARRCGEVTAIFVLKNSGQGYSDRVDICANTDSKLEPFETGEPEAIARRYLSGMAQPIDYEKGDQY